VTALVWSTDLPLRTMLIGFISPMDVLSIERIYVHLYFLSWASALTRREPVHCAKSQLLPEMADGGQRTADSGQRTVDGGRWNPPTARTTYRSFTLERCCGVHCVVAALECWSLLLVAITSCYRHVEKPWSSPHIGRLRRFKISFFSPPLCFAFLCFHYKRCASTVLEQYVVYHQSRFGASECK